MNAARLANVLHTADSLHQRVLHQHIILPLLELLSAHVHRLPKVARHWPGTVKWERKVDAEKLHQEQQLT